jgi:hypothetical protein
MRLSQRYDPSQTLTPDRADPAFGVGVEIWTPSGKPYTFDTTHASIVRNARVYSGSRSKMT